LSADEAAGTAQAGERFGLRKYRGPRRRV